MLKTSYFMAALFIFCQPAQASSFNDELRIEIKSATPADPTVASLHYEKGRSKVTYLRRSIPFLCSGAAAIAELTLPTRTTNPVILTATILWLGANIVGLGNLYLDYRLS